ncbi:hypothetical protein [Hymenobacter rubripertinctus]|uniref:Uncharacterized protein n=1 Tax=Hymenobacter rubripertinctus TaxID=2029981 RepID=A0A418R2H2_9BACT|nr:hypothetical protein [Hymenobacter rubripertinctus]RIY11613.1 hypothetical protein D0T11_07330 [Hymenobacter rubripertinctus]
MRKAYFGWLAGLPLLAACGPGEPAPSPETRRTAYFDLPGLLKNQSTMLNQRRPAVEKQVLLRDGKQQTTRVAQTDWAKELQVFQQADINKPALRGLYSVDSVQLPSGATQRTYRRLPGTDSPVEELSVTTQGTAVQSLTATVAQDNPLVYSAKHLEMRYQKGRLASYRVTGVQKLILFDSVHYAVRAIVQ